MKFRILFMFLIIMSCYSAKKKIVGTFQQKLLPDYSTLTLNSDESFTYFMYNHSVLGNISVYGNWKKLKNAIILNYDSIPPELIRGNLKINYSSVQKKDSIAIKIIDNDGKPMIGSTLLVNNEENFINSMDGVIYTKPELIKKISYRLFQEDELISISLNKFIDTDIQLIVTPNIKRALVYDVLPEKFIIRKDSLYYHSEGETYFANPYIRIQKH